ncbi:M20 metallopeptidase family protein [Nocardioides hwasunensis]|uniref:Amidohydrolase n=1 Tax=Nocardioides hwasunensis TaxID=397258 RepID=A0ABR8MN94_9ACTN|nr:M20 family metallopeptidase [Nocardioides hwasunensis]MBD3915559.1 amidohydrolase [Nocardioides hwasunensis]
MSTDGELFALLETHLPRANRLREQLHAEPELSGTESMTRDLVLQHLPPSGTPVTKVAETGAVVRIGGPGPAIGMRGELDALPISEETGAPFSSTRDGVMHACGHDVHLAALVAVAWTIHESDLDFPLLAVLQPREETYPSGALDISEDGILEEEQCAAMLGAHLQPILDAGTVACVPGGVNASADEFEILVHGTSGHAAYPHLTADPVLAMAGVIVALQTIVSRSVDPMTAAVVGVSSLNAGSAANVVPATARATGTIRAMSSTTRALLRSRIEDIASNVARAHGCAADVQLTSGEPVLENDPQLVEAVSKHLHARGLTLSTTLRSLGADDFSYFSERIPSAMLFIGSESSAHLHASDFLPTAADLRVTAQALLAGYLGAVERVRAGG